MGNLADYIEKFILLRLSGQQDNSVVVNRNDLAQELDCAPSQISYVVNTRFTVTRGFVVESRRGSGGFIRIARASMANAMFETVVSRIVADQTGAEIDSMVEELRGSGLMTKREAAMLLQFVQLMQKRMEPEERVQSLRAIFATLSNFS
ncbi:MAG TPA: CtsR family transcriptional regulator [Negativicutes bacterium]|nr:CtsR family transcriptional regulator [Negativicutes bacterium]